MKNYLLLDNSIDFDSIDNSTTTDDITYILANDVLFPTDINTDSAPWIIRENHTYYDAENIKEEYYTILLERLVYSLLEEGRTKEARSILKQHDKYSSPLIDRWKKALFKDFSTKMKKASLGKDEIEKESAWIKNEGQKYSSKWVALISGKVYASGDDLNSLKKELEDLNKDENITFLKL